MNTKNLPKYYKASNVLLFLLMATMGVISAKTHTGQINLIGWILAVSSIGAAYGVFKLPIKATDLEAIGYTKLTVLLVALVCGFIALVCGFFIIGSMFGYLLAR